MNYNRLMQLYWIILMIRTKENGSDRRRQSHIRWISQYCSVIKVWIAKELLAIIRDEIMSLSAKTKLGIATFDENKEAKLST